MTPFESIVLAGGMGTRLKSISGDTPKPMVDVAGKPFLTYVMDALLGQGVNHIILAVSYRHELISDQIGNSYLGVPVSYSIETEPLGTGGGIRQALSLANTSDVLVVNGDTYLDLKIDAFFNEHIAQNKATTLALINVEDTYRYGRVELSDNTIVNFSEKGQSGAGIINGGAYVVKKNALNALPLQFSFEEEYLKPNRKDLGFHLCDGYFIDIGIPEDYHRACKYFQKT